MGGLWLALRACVGLLVWIAWPMPPDRLVLFITVAISFGHVFAGLWLSPVLLWSGLGLTALAILGWLPVPAYLGYWMAFLGGGGLIGLGIHILSAWKQGMADLDPVIHQPVRLRVMASLAALHETEAAEFAFPRDLLGVTDGDLGAHVRRLEEEGYLLVDRTFVQRKPRTFIARSGKGRRAYKGHATALESILRGRP
jgi:DNA-binding MarR family transcriptional regulator